MARVGKCHLVMVWASAIMVERAVDDDNYATLPEQIHDLHRSIVQVACVIVLFGARSVRTGINNLTLRAVMEHVVVD